MGFRLYNTPKDFNDLGKFKDWMTSGFQLFNASKKLGYPSINEENIECLDQGTVEVFSHASFGILKGYILQSKSTD